MKEKKPNPAVLFTNAGKCSVDAGIHTGYACLHCFSVLSLEPEPHLTLPNHDTGSFPDAVQRRSEALFFSVCITWCEQDDADNLPLYFLAFCGIIWL